MFTPSTSSNPTVEIASSKIATSSVTPSAELIVELPGRTDASDKANTEDLPSAEAGEPVQLEKGIFKRIENLINNKFERVNRDLRSHLEDIVTNRLKVELEAEREQEREQVLLELSRMLNEDPEKLLGQIQKVRQSKTESPDDKASDK